MKHYAEKLEIKLQNAKNESVNKICKNKSNTLNKDQKLEISVFLNEYNSDNHALAKFISNHIAKRGFEDAVELKIVRISEKKVHESFVIIGNRVIKNLNQEETIRILNHELDNILYTSLEAAKRDQLNTRYA